MAASMKEPVWNRDFGYWYSRRRTLGTMAGYGLLALLLGGGLALSFHGDGNGIVWWLGGLACLFFIGLALWEGRRYFQIDRPALLIHSDGCDFWDGGSGELRLRWEEILPVEATCEQPRVEFLHPFTQLWCWLLQRGENWKVTVRYPQRGTGNRLRGEDLGTYTLAGRDIDADAREVVQAMNEARALALRGRACPLPSVPAGADDDELAEHARLRWLSEHTLPNDPWDERVFAEQLGPHTTESRGGGSRQVIHTYGEIGARVIVKPGKLIVRGEWVDPRAMGVRAVRGLSSGTEVKSDQRAPRESPPPVGGGGLPAMPAFRAPLPRSYSYSSRNALLNLVLTTLSILIFPPVFLWRLGVDPIQNWWWLLPLQAGLAFFWGLDNLRRLGQSNGTALLLSAQGCQLRDAGGRLHRLAWNEVLPAVAVRVKHNSAFWDYEWILDLICWLFRLQDWEITLRYPKPGTGNRFRGEDFGSVAVLSRAIGVDADVLVDEINRFRAQALRHSALALPELPDSADRDGQQLHDRQRWFVEHTLLNDPWDVGAFRDALGSKNTEELPGPENFKAHTYGSIGGRVIVRPGKLVVRAEWIEPEPTVASERW